MSEMYKDWIVVVAPSDEDRARVDFEQWKREHTEWSRMLGPQDIRIDVIRSEDGRTLYRYLVRPDRARQ